MKLFTIEQKEWFFRKKIKVGDFYMFPRFGFIIYEKPSYLGKSEHMNTNPFTKSLDNEYFRVKEITDNGFVKGNFDLNQKDNNYKPHYSDFYLTLDELSTRGLLEVLFLFLVCSIPLIIYNQFKKIFT